MRYRDLTYCFVTTFETQNNDFSYHDQRPVRVSCGEKIVKIYRMVVLEIDVKLRVAFYFLLLFFLFCFVFLYLFIFFFFAFSIYKTPVNLKKKKI